MSICRDIIITDNECELMTHKSNKILNESDPSTALIAYVYYDPGVNFTDGTVLNLPYGVYFQISANNSFPNDTLPTYQSYPVIQLMDPDLLNNENKHADTKLTELQSEGTNSYVLSPYQAINPSQFTTTFEEYNQSSTLTTYKETS
ncbi:3150_t:CDS:2, partial [Racocetra fulgida]